MKKFVKITGIVLASIIVLLIVLPFAFKGKIVSTIKEEANKNLNAKLEFEDVRLSLIRNFPNFSIRLDELSLAGVDTFESDTLIRFRRFEAGLNLMSVISGEQIEINKVILSGAKINAIVLEDGTANWDIMITDSTESEPEVAEEEPAEDTAPMVLQLKKIAVEHSDIIYNDKESDVFAELSDFNFELKGDLTDDITNLNIKTWIQKITVSSEGVRYLSSAKAEFEGEINADLEQSIYTFKENKFKLNAIALAFDGTVEMPDTNIVTDVTFAVSDTKFRSILSMIPAIYKKDLEGVETSGTFNMTGYAKGTYNGMNMPAYGVNLLIKDGRFNYPDLPESIENIQVDLAVKAEEGSGDDMTIDINKAHIETAGNPFDAQIHIAMTAADTYLKGELNGKIDFGTLESLVPLEETKIKGILKTDLSFEGKLSDIDNERYDQFKADGIMDLQNFELTGADYPPTQISKMLLRFSPQYAALETFNARSGKS
ncbi:MAG: AsmA family protein, partial [Bacteroidota bacterium]|nr:AsmA family protein [Bacteroidota bacterium]